MSNNKQSSLEYFWKQLEEKGNAHIETDGVITVNITIDVNEYRLLQKQAKAMHKEEMIQSYSNGWHDGQDIIINGIAHIQVGGDAAGQQYYNETFGGNNEQTN